MTRLVAFAVLLTAAAGAPVEAQTSAQIEAEPIVKLREGETLTPDQCLSEQELELIDALNALRRPTVGVEREGEGDDPAPFDPHYLVGTWNIEGVLPESPLAPSGFFAGTETVHHVSGCTYESTIEAAVDDAPVTIEALMVYDRRARYLVRIEDDSRGFRLVKLGRVGGDPGGYFSHHWEAAPITRQDSRTREESRLRLRGRTYMTSPFAYQVRTRISIDGGPFVNFGGIWWERAEAEPER